MSMYYLFIFSGALLKKNVFNLINEIINLTMTVLEYFTFTLFFFANLVIESV